MAGIVDDGIRGFSPCLADMDGDHYPELLLVADFGTSEYFVNNGDGTFVESTSAAGVGLEYAGMGSTVGDSMNESSLPAERSSLPIRSRSPALSPQASSR